MRAANTMAATWRAKTQGAVASKRYRLRLAAGSHGSSHRLKPVEHGKRPNQLVLAHRCVSSWQESVQCVGALGWLC
jgi:hypothetical protein